MSSSQKDDSDRSFQLELASYDASRKIMLLSVVSFSIIILLVFAYYLYARFVLRHRRSTFQGLSVIISHPPKRGLDSRAISSLPTFVVGVDLAGKECAVCLSLLEVKDTVRMLPDCKHVFHVSCVDTWLTTCSTCPVCRTDVYEPRARLEPEPREGPVGEVALATASSLDETSSNRNNHSCVDQDRVVDLERQ